MMTALKSLSLNSNIWFIWVLVFVDGIFPFELRFSCDFSNCLLFLIMRLWVRILFSLFFFSASVTLLMYSARVKHVFMFSFIMQLLQCGSEVPLNPDDTRGVEKLSGMPTSPAFHHVFLCHWYHMWMETQLPTVPCWHQGGGEEVECWLD